MDNPTGWASLPSHISPVLFQIGSFQLRWYSLMYLVAFGLTYFLVVRRIRQEKFPYTPETIQDLFIWIVLGLILGGRLGYVLFYNLDYYSHHLLEIFLPFEFTGGVRFVGISGMSFHGGLVGVLLAAIWFCRRNGIAFWNIVDLICPAVPLGYTFGRLGNFLNGELWGRATTMPWGMYFPLDPTGQLRHPSQLYEALFEGIVLFAILWAIRRKSPFDGFLFSLYLIGYGLIRFVIEFFREPDAQLGLLLFSLSMGQILCLLMIGAGLAVFWIRKTAVKRNR
ncbi:MAG: prolipoprotein diacylglyceryl transferase [Deltaproteobacteria bacterium HGW-Deltaproteobacteria-19]|jgi:phosphatidylglycerol:prolipoprotein diacylglycerol transferase|nr:MAG: prolipoprotein diacylglyceryl transferase [Deltaproteobacteria bacterium HGW-Deltaproteobacteria-19]